MSLKIRVPNFLIILTVLFSCNFIYIFHESWLPVSCSDIAVIFSLLLFLYTINYVGIDFRRENGYLPFSRIFVWYLGIAIMAAIRSNQLYGQSIVSGLLPQRTFVAGMLLSVSVSMLLREQVISRDEITDIICKIGKLQIMICALQYVVGESYVFMDVSYSVGRFSTLRLYCATAFVLFLLFQSLSNILNHRRGIDILWLVLSVAFIAFITQSRLELIAVIAAILCTILTMRSDSNTKIGYVIVGIIALAIFLNTEFAQSTIDSIMTQTADEDDIRAVGKALLVSGILQSPLIGRGYINSTNANAAASLYAYNEYGGIRKVGLNDNGIYSLTYLFGFIGLAWIVILFLKILKNSWQVMRQKNIYTWFMFWIYFIVVSPNITNWYFEEATCFVFMIFIALLEYDTTEYKTDEEIEYEENT
ncbi:MAG: hypothetical protein LUG99_01605 [Lachnospiraceae bacterium]|nr:hypothetical protein [Lachnospiraceae bacterium]